MKILSIEGDGIYTLVSIKILEKIEEMTKKSIQKLFDLVISSKWSTLPSLALGMKKPVSASDLLYLHTLQLKSIFKHSMLRTLAVWKTKYDRDELDKFLDDLFQDECLSKLHYQFASSFSDSASKEYMVNSLAAKKHTRDDFYLRDISKVSATLEGYFPYHGFTDLAQQKSYIGHNQGKLANNLCLLSMIMTNYLAKHPLNNYSIVSIKIGKSKHSFLDTTDITFPSLFSHQNFQQFKNNQRQHDVFHPTLTQQLIKSLFQNIFYLHIPLNTQKYKLDDVSCIDYLLNLTEEFIENNQAIFGDLKKLLCSSIQPAHSSTQSIDYDFIQ